MLPTGTFQMKNPLVGELNLEVRHHHVNHRNNAILAEYREIEKKLSNKNKFMCTHCHEVNTINLRLRKLKRVFTE